jgi:FHA domain
VVAPLTPSEWLVLGLRLLFVALLYGAVLAIFFSLRRELRRGQQDAAGRSASATVDAERGPGGPSAPPRLTLVEASPLDGAPGRAVTLWGDLTIGRRPPADVLLLDDAVSGRHARFARHNGEWVVEDLASTNGTFVNGRRLTQPVVLQPGDVVVTGGASWRFEPGTRGVEGGAA